MSNMISEIDKHRNASVLSYQWLNDPTPNGVLVSPKEEGNDNE